MNDDDLHTAWVKRAMELAHEVALAYSEMSSDGENDHMGEWHAARNTLREHLLDQPASMALTEPELRAGIALQRNEIERLRAQKDEVFTNVDVSLSQAVGFEKQFMTPEMQALTDAIALQKLPAVTCLMGRRCGEAHPLDDVNEIQINHQLYSSKYEEPKFDLWYPQLDGHCKAMVVGLSDTRAACDLRIVFSHERHEWVISKRRWNEEVDDYEWVEVAAIGASFLGDED